MTPTPQEYSQVKETVATDYPQDANSIVISGMSGLYPQSRYIEDFEKILYDKVNPITTEGVRWQYNHPEVAQYGGCIPDLDRFDAQFFKVHYRLGCSMDAMAKKILEQSYEAIYDAGINPHDLSGKKVGVYIGTCFSESEKACFYVANSRTGFGIAGCSKTMFANRISYWLNAKGPSMSIDEACCSSTAALEQAYLALARGECEAAIVGGAYLCLHPQSSVHYSRVMTLSKDGKTKSFDQNANGCSKSEAVNVLFLQKAKDALRIYAHVKHVKSEFRKILEGKTGPRYGFYRDSYDTAQFLKTFYEDVRIPPQMVEYVEAFGSAVPEADKSELEAIAKVFCESRSEPLLVGSVMSNIGYGEAASGISAITKVLLGYHRGVLAGNLHCDTPRTDVAALREGRMKLLTDHHRFSGTYTAVNSMSVTGVNAHVLLYGHNKPKDIDRYKSAIPRLVTISGRQESSVLRVLNILKTHPVEPEELALLNNIHKNSIAGHLGRGYIVLDSNENKETVSLSEKACYFDNARRPLWFVYSGMGSQWSGMGTALMKIPVFANAIERCHQALEPKGLNIVDIITSSDPTTFDNILHSFVGIAAVQIGLTDVLKELGLVPDGIIGHSVGELGCAYADGCLTAEEMILSAYSRGLVSLQTKFIRGSMAAVGLGYEQVSKICPPEIEVACHNSFESSTISGPADVMRNFVNKLTSEGIFAKEVPCSNIAYHSRYIAGAGPGLLKYLKEVIKNPRERSDRWVSTSVAKDKWNEPLAKLSSAEYHTNNLLNPVLFEETSMLIPSNAVLVEVAPHGLLQAILKRSLPESCINLPLTRRGHPDNVLLFLEAIGKLYMEGFNIDLQCLYSKIEFPVSTGTPFLSKYVDWAHEEKWNLPLYSSACRTVAASCKHIVSINDDDYSYLKGHVIKQKVLLPSAFVLVAVWDTLAMVLGLSKRKFNVEFDDVRFYCQPVLHTQRQIRLNVSLHRGNGRFEVLDDFSKVATGFIKSAVQFNDDDDDDDETPITQTSLNLSTRDIYHLFDERDYSYSGEFRSIYCVNDSLTEGKLFWKDNWVTLIDGMLQLNALKHAHSAVSRPDRIRSLTIDTKRHMNNAEIMNGNEVLPARISEVYDLTRCGGIVIKGVRFHNLSHLVGNEVTLKTMRFVPRFQCNGDILPSLEVFYQIVAENINKDNLKVIHIIDGIKDTVIGKHMKHILSDNVSGLELDYNNVNKNSISQNLFKDVDVVVVQNLSNDDNMCKILYNMLPTQTFLINEEDESDEAARVRPSSLYSVVAVNNNKNDNVRLELVRWRSTPLSSFASSTITIRSESDLPLLVNARNNLMPQSELFIVTSYPPPVNGLKELVKQWRRDIIRNRIYLVMVYDGSTRISDVELPNVDLAFNILDNGVWGGEYFSHANQNQEIAYDVILQSEQVGNIESLKWVESPQVITTGMKVKVHYAGINVDDVRKASGLKPADDMSTATSSYGMEFSGITETGEKVMGLVENGSTRSTLLAHPELTWPVPSHWSLEDAATVPLAYVYVFYCFYIKTINLIRRQYTYTVLIHGGAGALGQAAISVALASGYRVFTTVSDLQKKKFLLKLFPDLKDENIGCSRDISFADMVLKLTAGKGADIVLSCVKGEFKDFSLKACAPFGVTFDTDQVSSMEQYTFGLNNLSCERAYIAVDIRSIFSNPPVIKRIREYMVEGMSGGWVRPLSRMTFASVEAPRAFRLLAASKHRGRVLLQLTDTLDIPSTFRLVCSAHHNHLIVGDSESLVSRLADRLVSRGAKNLHLHLPQTSAVLDYKINLWQSLEVKVKITTGDLTDDKVIEIIKQAKKSGFLAGVYITNTEIDLSLINNFDIATRRLAPYLKHFLILEFGEIKSDIHLICFQRSKDGPPATYLKIIRDIAANDRAIVESIEKSLCCQYPFVIPQLITTMYRPLQEQIAELVGLGLDKKSPNTSTLQELGLEQEKSEMVSTFLNDIYNVYVDKSDVPLLTLEKLKEIENISEEKQLCDTKDFETFFTFVDADELLATTEMVFLPTLSNSSDMREDEFDTNETYLWIVPGMEGHHNRFRTLCERLKLPALVLQPGLDYLQEDPHQLATRYYQVMMKKIDATKKFYILGVESGVSVALELAALLEKQGLTGTVYCVGDGPKETIEFIEKKLTNFSTEEELERGLIKHMFKLMVGDECEYSEVEKAMSRCSTWSQRVEVCVRILLGRVSHSAQYARSLIDAAYSRLLTARHHALAPKLLKSQIVLLRAHTAHATSARTSLQDYSSQPVIVYDLPTPLARITEDLRCTAIINRHLSKDIIDAFNERSLCDSYLLNSDVFMVSSGSQ